MSINAHEAHKQSSEALYAIMTAADKVFIASVDAQIQTAIALGLFQVTAVTTPDVSINTVFQYYNNLKYLCSFPDYLQQNGMAFPTTITVQPADFFGFNWTQFWLNAIGAFHIKSPARMTVRWNLAQRFPEEPV